MFKSVFAKYITAFALIIMLCFFVLFNIITTLFNDYADVKQETDIRRVVDLTADFSAWAEDASLPEAGNLSRDGVLSAMLDRLAKINVAKVIILADREGNIRLVNRDMRDSVPSVLPREDLAKLKELSSSDECAVLDLKNWSFTRDQMNYGKEIRRKDGTLWGYVVVSLFPEQEQSLLDVTAQTILMSLLWVMLAVLIAVYFITDRMVEPIIQMRDASKNYAKGKFDEKIPVNGHDEIAELSQSFNLMASSLEQMETMRNAFLANVSHDLRTPMTSIAGFIDGILNGAIPPEKQTHYLEIVRTEILRLSRLVSEILDVSRLESGDRHFVFRECDICETARLVIISFEQQINEKKLQIAFDCEEECMSVSAAA
ncbi:MAG: HAMP domain-containing histidine kinase, partial [Clostridia bacterium]|nr:HAMP domain-containing histidine kinase [Clostridia bacterium]